ncbi:hypothetical protein [Lysinibacillus sp. NPDC047702]|uniref:hypothetical protein n=1 Tax=unclassified Lysinibacillus TaxID=2636778 RepID=UPI003D01D9D6
MKIFVLEVNYERFFEVDEVNDVVVLAENLDEAIRIAKGVRDVEWELEEEHDIKESKLIKSIIHHG